VCVCACGAGRCINYNLLSLSLFGRQHMVNTVWPLFSNNQINPDLSDCCTKNKNKINPIPSKTMFIYIGFIWLLHPNVCNFFLHNNSWKSAFSKKSGFTWLLFQALQLLIYYFIHYYVNIREKHIRFKYTTGTVSILFKHIFTWHYTKIVAFRSAMVTTNYWVIC